MMENVDNVAEALEFNDIENTNEQDNNFTDNHTTQRKRVTREEKESMGIINKRIDFDKKTLKRLETMIPVYSDEIKAGATQNEMISFVVAKAINSLFENDFKSKLDSL